MEWTREIGIVIPIVYGTTKCKKWNGGQNDYSHSDSISAYQTEPKGSEKD